MALRALSSFFFRFEKHGSKRSLTLPVQCSSILCLVFMFLPGLLLLIPQAFTQRRHPISLEVSDTPVLGEVPFLSAPCSTFCFLFPSPSHKGLCFFLFIDPDFLINHRLLESREHTAIFLLAVFLRVSVIKCRLPINVWGFLFLFIQ